MSYDELIAEAARVEFQGWDFGVFEGRFTEDQPSWDYAELVAPQVAKASSLLDMGTGGGEFLASLTPLPNDTAATEAYAPNVPLARRRLEPLGVTVAHIDEEGDDALPFADNSFELVINRHEAFSASEIARILVPGGRFITQQVGGRDCAELNAALGAPSSEYADWRAEVAVDGLKSAGLRVAESREEFPYGEFRDIGAIALYLRVAPWQIAGYSPGGYDQAMRALYDRMAVEGPLQLSHHRFLIAAEAPL